MRNMLPAIGAGLLLWTKLIYAQTPPTIEMPPIAQSPAASAVPADSPTALEVFKGPQRKRVTPPRYPESERVQGRDGWVNLNFMIDPQGKPYEVMVEDSTGNKVLEKSAIRAAEGWEFEPATLAGKPIDSGYTIKVNFVLSGESGASSGFVKAYKKFLNAAKTADRPKADAAMATMQVRNLYEDAYFNLAQYEYARHWGTQLQQLAAVKRAIAEECTANYLSKEAFLASLQVLLNLQIGANDFAGALQTWGKLQESGDKAAVLQWEPSIQKINALRTAASPYSVAGDFEGSSSWSFQLFRRRFHVAVTNGSIAEIKLRCDKRYVFFKYEADLQYTISDKYGDCSLELVGDPGTTFNLIQS
jgi:TonB family protein